MKLSGLLTNLKDRENTLFKGYTKGHIAETKYILDDNNDLKAINLLMKINNDDLKTEFTLSYYGNGIDTLINQLAQLADEHERQDARREERKPEYKEYNSLDELFKQFEQIIPIVCNVYVMNGKQKISIA